MNIVVIGIGGIGSHLVRPLCRYLNELRGEKNLTLIDGDRFEPKNESRQEFLELGNKAEVIANELQAKYPDFYISGKAWYVTEENIHLAIHDGDIVFSCVDNHATRKVLSDRCKELQDVTLISGGNEYSDGNVQVFIRENGNNLTPPLTHLHPEIEKPADKNPGEMSCEELARSGSPQLIFTNFLASAWMLTTFWKVLNWFEESEDPFGYSEIYFDAVTGNSRSVDRS